MSMKEVQFKISVGDPEVDNEDYLYKMTKDLRKELERIDLHVDLEKEEKVPNTRGELVKVGRLSVKAFTSGSVSSLINLIRNWIKKRKTSFKFRFTNTSPDGTVTEEIVEVDNANISSKKINALFDKLAEKLEG